MDGSVCFEICDSHNCLDKTLPTIQQKTLSLQCKSGVSSRVLDRGYAQIVSTLTQLRVRAFFLLASVLSLFLLPRRSPLAATTLFAMLTALSGTSIPAQAQTDEQPVRVPSNWALKPPNIQTGERFRLISVTGSKRDATSSNIADYNTHVQADLNRGNAHEAIKAYSSYFKVLGSTATVDARDNTGTNPNDNYGVSIYWLGATRQSHGPGNEGLIANNYADLYDGSWINTNPTRRQGRPLGALTLLNLEVATGSDKDGTAANDGYVLGNNSLVVTGKPQVDNAFRHSTALASSELGYIALSPVFIALNDGIPYIASVEITSNAGSDNDYATGDVIEVTVTYNEAVTVTGTPNLTLNIGANTRDASYDLMRSTTTALAFTYTVTTEDNDNKGISIDKNVLSLSGGTIAKQSDSSINANLFNPPLPQQPEHRVYQVPYIVGVDITSTPRASSNTYGLGETIEATITFSEPVTIDRMGTIPGLGLQIGSNSRTATYRRTEGSSLLFGYVVMSNDIDSDGIRVRANGLTGTIHSTATERDANLTYELKNFSAHRVNANLMPPISMDASLASLELSGITLNPAFSPGTTTYTAEVQNSVTFTTVTPTKNDNSATVAYMPSEDANDMLGGHQVNLGVGQTTITVTVTAGDNNTTSTYTVTVNRLAAGNLPEITIASGTSMVTEGTAVTVTLSRTGSTTDALTVSISITQTGEVIKTADNYEVPTAVTIPANAASATVTIETQTDETDEPNGAVTATVTPQALYTIGSTSSAEVTVTDNDATPVVSLVLSPASISENGETSTVTATLDRASSEATTVVVSVIAVPPATASDFNLSSNTTLTIAAGMTTSTGTVTITANDNTLGSRNKNVTVSATATNTQGVTEPSSVTLTITNDDAAPSAPTNLTATPGNTKVTLGWDAPASTADITGHQYRYKTDGNYPNTWTSIDNSAPSEINQNSFAVTGLMNGKTYKFQVRAVNMAGNSEPSDEATALSGAGLGICDRTENVYAGILNLIDGVTDCADVTSNNLSEVEGTLSLSDQELVPKLGDFSGLSSLDTLDISSNDITSLDPMIFSGLSSLTTLDISSNDITSLDPMIFSGLSSLTTLDILGNDITILNPTIFSGLSSLTTLILEENQITSIDPAMFPGLSSLTTLNLKGNNIGTLNPAIFSGLSSLTTLKLKGCQITSIDPAMFPELPSLTTLNLSGNNIVIARRNMFSRLSKLSELNLGSNAFTWITFNRRALAGLSKLKILNLSFNSFHEQAPDSLLYGLTSLDSLFIEPVHLPHFSWKIVLKKTGVGKFKATVPMGAPFEVVLPVSINDGSTEGQEITVTIPTGAIESETATVTRTPGTTQAATITIGTLAQSP